MNNSRSLIAEKTSMENQDVNKFTWIINNFSSLQTKVISSDHFIIDGCEWRLLCYPQGYKKSDNFTLFLAVANYKSLPSGWRRHARYLLTVVNRNSDKISIENEESKWFDRKIPGWGLSAMFRSLKNDELKIVVVVNVLEVIGKLELDVHEAKETQPLNKIKLEYDEKIMDIINDFQVLPSQVALVRKIFEKHPDIALELRAKNPLLRKACMNFLLSLIEALCQPLGKLSNEDLVEADNALAYLKHSGFEVVWLEKNLEKLKEKKDEQQICEANLLASRDYLVWPDDVF